MSAESSEAIHNTVRVFISETPDLTEWARSLDRKELLQELELVEYSMQEGTYIVPPSPLVGLVQGAGLKQRWRTTLKALRPFLPSHMRSSEREMCAIGLVWCELLMDTCSSNNGGDPPFRESLSDYPYRARS
ncbi:MAG TPA: hypothetical protein VLU25_04635 [Acidobacteriota bacterium]|nr:hypothetical protein [Acidobacteriota bacterium]